jgi:hypothetical protein
MELVSRRLKTETGRKRRGERNKNLFEKKSILVAYVIILKLILEYNLWAQLHE